LNAVVNTLLGDDNYANAALSLVLRCAALLNSEGCDCVALLDWGGVFLFRAVLRGKRNNPCRGPLKM